MKKNNLFKKMGCIFLTASLLAFSTTNAYGAVSLPASYNIKLCGIKDSDREDRTSWQSDAKSNLSKLGANINCYTAFNNTQLESYIKSSDIFIIHSHGSMNTLQAVDSTGKTSLLTKDTIKSWNKSSLNNLDLAFIGACQCGKGGTSSDNLINAMFSRGARCVIGYSEKVYTDANRIMIKEFCKAIGNGYTISKALQYADSQVLAQYGSNGRTNNRLCRGDLSKSFSRYSQLLSVSENMSVPGNTINLKQTTDINLIKNLKETKTISLLPEINYEEIAYSQLQQNIVDWNNYYLLENYYTPDTSVYTYIFERKNELIHSTDRVYILINQNETIQTFSTNYMEFSDLSLTETSINKCDQKLSIQLDNLNIVNYSIIDKILVKNLDTIGIRYSIKIDNEIADFFVELED